MKEYCVSVDITMSKNIYVDAESEEQAMELAKEKVKNEPFYFAGSADAFVNVEATDANECDVEEANPDGLAYSLTMRDAVKYVKDNMQSEDLVIISAQIDKNYNQHMNPAYNIDDGRIIDLLEEYGQDHELPEGWWEDECDIDDIVLLLDIS